MAAILKVRHHSRNLTLCQSIRIYLKNNPAIFDPEPISNAEP